MSTENACDFGAHFASCDIENEGTPVVLKGVHVEMLSSKDV